MLKYSRLSPRQMRAWELCIFLSRGETVSKHYPDLARSDESCFTLFTRQNVPSPPDIRHGIRLIKSSPSLILSAKWQRTQFVCIILTYPGSPPLFAHDITRNAFLRSHITRKHIPVLLVALFYVIVAKMKVLRMFNALKKIRHTYHLKVFYKVTL